MALVGMSEDEGLIDPCVDNLRRIGVSHIVLYCIEGFASEAPALTKRYAEQAEVTIVPIPAPSDLQALLAMAGPAIGPQIERVNPDWIFALDVDEFPIVQGGDLRRLAALSRADTIRVPRYNYARRVGESGTEILTALGRAEDMSVIVDQRDTMKDLDTPDGPRWSFHQIAPKVMLRPHMFLRMGVGTHTVSGWKGDTKQPVEETSREIAIVHVPFTSFTRFEQKVRNAEAHIETTGFHDNRNSAWHWKWWVRRYQEGGLRQEFDREALSGDEYGALVRSRTIQRAGALISSDRDDWA